MPVTHATYWTARHVALSPGAPAYLGERAVVRAELVAGDERGAIAVSFDSLPESTAPGQTVALESGEVATVTGEALERIQGASGWAARFTGAARLALPRPVATAAYAVAFRIRRDGSLPASRFRAITSATGNPFSYAYHVWLDDWALSTYDTTTGGLQPRGYTIPDDGAWHHVVLSVSSGTGTWYVDGVQVGTALTPVDATSRPISHVGNDANEPGGNVSRPCGPLDDVRIYPRELTAADVAALVGAQAALPLLKTPSVSFEFSDRLGFGVLSRRTQLDILDADGAVETLLLSEAAASLSLRITVQPPGAAARLTVFDGVLVPSSVRRPLARRRWALACRWTEEHALHTDLKLPPVPRGDVQSFPYWRQGATVRELVATCLGAAPADVGGRHPWVPEALDAPGTSVQVDPLDTAQLDLALFEGQRYAETLEHLTRSWLMRVGPRLARPSGAPRYEAVYLGAYREGQIETATGALAEQRVDVQIQGDVERERVGYVETTSSAVPDGPDGAAAVLLDSYEYSALDPDIPGVPVLYPGRAGDSGTPFRAIRLSVPYASEVPVDARAEFPEEAWDFETHPELARGTVAIDTTQSFRAVGAVLGVAPFSAGVSAQLEQASASALFAWLGAAEPRRRVRVVAEGLVDPMAAVRLTASQVGRPPADIRCLVVSGQYDLRGATTDMEVLETWQAGESDPVDPPPAWSVAVNRRAAPVYRIIVRSRRRLSSYDVGFEVSLNEAPWQPVVSTRGGTGMQVERHPLNVGGALGTLYLTRTHDTGWRLRVIVAERASGAVVYTSEPWTP